MRLINYSLGLGLALALSQTSIAMEMAEWTALMGSLPPSEQHLRAATDEYVASRDMRPMTAEELRELGPPNTEWLNKYIDQGDHRKQLEWLKLDCSGPDAKVKFSREFDDVWFLKKLRHVFLAKIGVNTPEALGNLNAAIKESFDMAASLDGDEKIVTEILANFVTLLGTIANLKDLEFQRSFIPFNQFSESFERFKQAMLNQNRPAIVNLLEKVKNLWTENA